MGSRSGADFKQSAASAAWDRYLTKGIHRLDGSQDSPVLFGLAIPAGGFCRFGASGSGRARVASADFFARVTQSPLRVITQSPTQAVWSMMHCGWRFRRQWRASESPLRFGGFHEPKDSSGDGRPLAAIRSSRPSGLDLLLLAWPADLPPGSLPTAGSGSSRDRRGEA